MQKKLNEISINRTKKFIQIKKLLNELHKNYPNVYKRPHIMSNAIIFNGIVFNFLTDFNYINLYPLRSPNSFNFNLYFENIYQFSKSIKEKGIFEYFENHYKKILNYNGHL